MTDTEELLTSDSIVESIDSSALCQFGNDDNDEFDDIFHDITFCSQNSNLPNSTLEYKKNEYDNQSDYIVKDNFIEEDFQWNEQTWLPESSMKSDLVLNNVNENSLDSSFHTTHETSLRPVIENSQIKTAVCDGANTTYISQSKFSSFSCFSNSVLNITNDISMTEKFNENSTFYGLPNRVKLIMQKVKKITNLYDWQHECLNLESVKKRQNLIYALPTSGGKTLVAEILMLKEVVCNRKNVIFVLPYIAIVQEKIQSMAPFALELEFLLEEYAGTKGQYPPVKRRRKNCIYICTIEKAASLLNSLMEKDRLNEIGLIVVDELHLIGESSGRGATLEGFLTKLMYARDEEHIQIVGMSATIGNLNEIATFLKADLYIRNFRPVQLKEYIKCENLIWLIDLHEEEIFTEEKKINYRYSEAALQLDPDRIGGLVMDVVPNDSCLIFCSNRKNCENVALLMTRVLFKYLIDHRMQEKMKLLNALKAEANLCPILSQTIRYGVAYHHSGLTAEERRLIEDAYRVGTICVICCTSTLAAGVNLPARRVILRSPYVGNEFLNLSKYKQMIGRAGRAGFGEIGESILICKPSEMRKVQELLKSKMEDCMSTLSTEEDRGINNLLLSSVMLSFATTRAELHKLMSISLLGIQSSRLGINIKQVTDATLIKLMKDQVLKVKEKPNFRVGMTISIQSQTLHEEIPNDIVPPILKKNGCSITIMNESVFELSDLGRAAMKGPIDLKSAHTLYDDLKMAQNHLVLCSNLHILYLISPYDLANKLKPIGSVYYDVVSSLPSSSMAVARVLGINEVAIVKLRDGIMPKNIEPRIVNRFYLSLILYDLWQHQSLYTVADKYQVNRGVVQNLLTSSASFAMSIVKFCQELPEFWAFTELLTQFIKKLTYCCSAELEILMELPAVKVGRAKQLYNAGYKTLQSVASANPCELLEKMSYMSRRMVDQIIAAANLLLLAKVENLKDEAAEMMEGLDTSFFSYS